MKTVLITGGAGYIGSHTAKALAAAGYSPVVLDNLSTGHRWAVRSGPLVEGEISDSALVERTIRRYDVKAILHFAAHASVAESVLLPQKYYRTNVIDSLTLLETAVACGIGRFIFSSTCATYGVPDTIPIAENQHQSPVNPYGDSKLFIEKALRSFDRSCGLRSVALRYFNAAGADPEGELGEVHTPETHLIPSVIQAALGEREAIEICGTDYRTGDGTAIRDYTHVADIARAHLLALQYIEDGGPTQAFNLGTGTGHSVKQVVSAVERVSRKSVGRRETERRPGDPPVLVADPTKAQKTLGWKAQFVNIDEIVRTAWDFTCSFRDRQDEHALAACAR